MIPKSVPQTYVDWYIKKTLEPNKQFLSWISKVEKTIQKKLSMSLTDLPDEDYMEYFESNYTPTDMVKIIFESNNLDY
jgi:hypothetical protein